MPVGKPATAILRCALDRSPDLIVMSTHGRTGWRKMFFGSTTERVLRETSVPVLVTPADDPGPASWRPSKRIAAVLVPIDLSAATTRQVRIARGLAEALDARLLLVHVMVPLPSADAECRDAMQRYWMSSGTPSNLGFTNSSSAASTPSLQGDRALRRVGRGDCAGRQGRRRGLVVMGLHSTVGAGPRMGSVTYRVLCGLPRLVLALPPMVEPRDLQQATRGAALERQSAAVAHA